MTDWDKKRDQAQARLDDGLARLREEERREDARRKYLLGQTLMTFCAKKPKSGAGILSTLENGARKLGSDDHATEIAALRDGGDATRYRKIILGGLLLRYRRTAPDDHRLPQAMRPFATDAARDACADYFDIPEFKDLTRPPEAAEARERHRDAVRVAATRLYAKKAGENGNFDLPTDAPEPDDDGGQDAQQSVLDDILGGDSR